MSGRIIRGYWSCKYCGTADIDGLVDVCPNCGKQKSSDVKYYMKQGIAEEVTDTELQKAKIKKEECDGKHKDWICPYCNQLNNYADGVCVACGAEKSEAEFEYGETKMDKSETKTDVFENTLPNETAPKDDENDTLAAKEETNSNEIVEKSPTNLRDRILSKIRGNKNMLKISGIIAAVFAVIGLLFFLFQPITKSETVVGFSWERTITIEEERTVEESDWYVPSGGRVYDERQEIRSYKSVLDHYETRTETKSRQVFDHNESYTTYSDNGNGTFTEQVHENPVYRTEYYTETYEEPVYRQEPVYDTKYYYEIERWFPIDTYSSKDDDKEPYWNTEYTLTEKQRDTKRDELYYVHYDDGQNVVKDETDYDTWLETKIGDGYEVTYNRLGMTYKREAIE